MNEETADRIAGALEDIAQRLGKLVALHSPIDEVAPLELESMAQTLVADQGGQASDLIDQCYEIIPVPWSCKTGTNMMGMKYEICTLLSERTEHTLTVYRSFGGGYGADFEYLDDRVEMQGISLGHTLFKLYRSAHSQGHIWPWPIPPKPENF